MRAAVVDRYGSPEEFRLERLPTPQPRQGEVLVEVRAAGINAIDWKTRAGFGVPIPRFPAVLGWDVSGVVAATGRGASRFGVGDEVFGLVRFPEPAGAYAEYVVAPEEELAPKPSGVDHRAAVGCMVALTAWDALFEQAGLERGQRVLVHGAAGGVGHVAVQLAHDAGAEVIGTASARNREFVLRLGADAVVDYTTTRLEESAKDVDVVVDTRSGEDFLRLLETLRPGGTIVTLLGEQDGQAAAAERRGVRLAYTYVAPDGRTLSGLSELMRQRRLRINVDRSFPLEDLHTAHTIGEQGHVRGLLVLDVS